MNKRMNLPTFTMYLEGKRFTVKTQVVTSWDVSTRKKPRVFVSVPTPEELGQTDGHPAYTERGADPVADAGWKVYNKLERQNMRAAAEAAVAGKLKFSKSAGCSSCPCSPGFVLEERVGEMTGMPWDVSYFVTLVAS